MAAPDTVWVSPSRDIAPQYPAGQRISHTSKLTKGSCIWPSSSTCTHVVSSAGRHNPVNQPTLFYRRGNCHDNAVAENFFNLLKRERIRRRRYKTREQARQDIFDYIEMFYNPKRKHVRNGMLSPVDLENRQRNLDQESV